MPTPIVAEGARLDAGRPREFAHRRLRRRENGGGAEPRRTAVLSGDGAVGGERHGIRLRTADVDPDPHGHPCHPREPSQYSSAPPTPRDAP